MYTVAWLPAPKKSAQVCVEVFGVRIDGFSTINERKLRMTNKKPISTTPARVCQTSKVTAAALQNLALQPDIAALAQYDKAFLPIVELLAQLSLANLQLAENIIRCILNEQTSETL